MLSRSRPRGFTMVELAVTVAIIGLLASLAAPTFAAWVRSARIRTVAEALQSGIKLAQTEAQRRAHTVVFFRTDSKDCNEAATVAATGDYWQVRTVANPLLTGDAAETLQCGVLTDVSTGVSLDGPAALCFSPEGRQITAAGVVGASACTAGNATYNVPSVASASSTDRALRIVVMLAGAIRLCDPHKSFPSSPDGCPGV